MQNLTPNQTLMLLLLVLFAAGFALCCLGVAPLMDVFSPGDFGAVFVFFCFGVIGAAAATIAIVGVLPSWPFWFRMPLSFWLGTLLFGLWTVGFSASTTVRGQTDSTEVLQPWMVAVFCYPLIFLAIQTPLWLIRALGNWTISRADDAMNRRPLTIRDMLAGITLIGFAMAGAQFARHLSPSSFASESDFWIGIGAAVASCFSISLMSIPPVVLATLRSSKSSMGMFILGAYAAVILTIAFVIIGIAEGHAPRGLEVVGGFIIVSSFLIATCATAGRATARMPVAVGT